jgi:alkylation response protein AidB-like acyl-CoA dehydrogenase
VDFRLTDEQQLLRQTVREFAEAEIRPHVREWDDAQRFPSELVPKLAALGLMGVQFPETYGGAAMSAIDYCLCIEELARVDPSVSLSVAAHNGLGPAHIAMFGTEAQKQKWLVPLARGEKLGAWALTEPNAGSDAAATRTTATREGECWVLNGAKTFITHGASADVMVVMAVTDRTRGAKGISAFVVERGTPGFLAGRKEDKLGMRASETTEVRFEQCRIPIGHLLGEEGQGFINALQVLDAGRIGIAALSVGLAQGRLRGRPLVRARATAVRPGDRVVPGDSMEARRRRHAHRGRAAAHVSRRVSQGSRPPDDAGVGHGEALRQRDRRARAEESVQIHGGYGFVKDYPAEKYFPRREAHHHRRGHQRDSAAGDRPSAAGLNRPCPRPLRSPTVSLPETRVRLPAP